MRVAATEGSDRTRLPQHWLSGLYGITPDDTATDVLLWKVEAALLGGARAIQYRSKNASSELQREQAGALARLCRGRALFIVNDDAELAEAVGADGVHVGEHDHSLANARRRVGPNRVVGVSCYDDLARAEQAAAGGADYVAFGSFFASSVKPGARTAHTRLLDHARHLGVPVVAIGGITAANAGALIAAGASAVAVISDLFGHLTSAAVTAAAEALATACSNALELSAR
jgi:thiamine-phosphate pyrophosphorylase